MASKIQDPTECPGLEQVENSEATDSAFQQRDSLHEAYSHLYEMMFFLRDRMFKITSGAIGVIIVADGWFITQATQAATVNFEARIAGALVIALVAVLASYSAYRHYREYLGCARMIVQVERALGFYEKGRFLRSESLYLSKAQEWGTGRYSSHIVRAHVLSLTVVAILSAALVLLL